MNSFIDLYDNRKAALFSKLKENNSVQEVVAASVKFFESIKEEYIQDITVLPLIKVIVPAAVDTLESSVQFLTAASITEIWTQESNETQTTYYEKINWKYSTAASIIQGILSLGTLVWLYFSKYYYYMIPVVLLFGVGVLRRFMDYHIERKYQKDLLSKKLRTNSPPPKIKADVKVDIDNLTFHLRNSVLEADKLFNRINATVQITDKESDMDIVKFLQDLLEASCSNDGEYALKKARIIPYLLEKMGLNTEYYEDKVRSHFEFINGYKPGLTYQTLKPAIVHIGDGRFILPGLVKGKN